MAVVGNGGGGAALDRKICNFLLHRSKESIWHFFQVRRYFYNNWSYLLVINAHSSSTGLTVGVCLFRSDCD